MSLNKIKAVSFCDRAAAFFLYGLILTISFTEAGTEVCSWYAIFFWLMKRVFGYRADGPGSWLPRTPLNAALGIFLAANALSVIFSLYPVSSLEAFFGKHLKVLALYFVVVETINCRQRLRFLLVSFIASMVLVAADSIFQYFYGYDFIRRRGSYRLTASFCNPNNFAGWLTIIIPFFWVPLAMRKKFFENKKALPFLWILVCLMLAFFIFTYARAAWMGISFCFLASYMYYIKNHPWRRAGLLLVPVLAIAAYIFLPQIVIDKTSALRNQAYVSSTGNFKRIISVRNIIRRERLWLEAVNIIEDYPWVGTGLNTYAKVARQYKTFKRGGVYPHNSFLQMTAETGLIGIFAFLCLLGVFFAEGWGCLTGIKNSFVPGLIFGIIAYLAHAFFDTHLYSLRLAVFFWVAVGLTIAVARIDGSNNPVLERPLGDKN